MADVKKDKTKVEKLPDGKIKVTKFIPLAPVTMTFDEAIATWDTISKDEQVNQLLAEVVRLGGD